ncbi:MAG: glycosyltransferase [Gammaproteobacteria bacterium]|jgi:glycosyltransferase involved in cell wall biosynthesis|nr:glycosyltransferase [Gammaproteobacteria bacterium]
MVSDGLRSPTSNGRGIILYDYLHCLGGAEQLTLTLMRAFPQSHLCVGYRDERLFPPAMIDAERLYDLRLPARFRGGRTLLGLLGFRFQTGFLGDYDWALFSGSVALEAVHQRPGALNLYYCHTLPRFAYDLESYYAASLPAWLRPALHVAAGLTRLRYARAIAQMDHLFVNSENIRQRLARYLGMQAQVVHPPCDLDHYVWKGQESYYLSTARLEPYKRIDRLIAAFRRLPDRTLVIGSGGSDVQRLKQLAAGADNIHFTGWLPDEALRSLVGRCIATLYVAQDEDFGMSPVESMAAGKPVIGVAEGGLLETVLDGITGYLIAEPSPEAICEAVQRLGPKQARAMRADCEARALEFGTDRFVAAISDVISRLA